MEYIEDPPTHSIGLFRRAWYFLLLGHKPLCRAYHRLLPFSAKGGSEILSSAHNQKDDS